MTNTLDIGFSTFESIFESIFESDLSGFGTRHVKMMKELDSQLMNILETTGFDIVSLFEKLAVK